MGRAHRAAQRLIWAEAALRPEPPQVIRFKRLDWAAQYRGFYARLKGTAAHPVYTEQQREMALSNLDFARRLPAPRLP